jgi:tripartite-type tricarboxylate transporter receptor subunit TctC
VKSLEIDPMVRSVSRRHVTTLLALAGIPPALPLSAQEAWPTGPVRIIGLGQPGSLSDVIGRIMAEALTRRLGQQFIVEHRPGAGGTVGVAYTAKSKPDGYTVVLVSAGPLGIGPSLYQNPGYDAAKDLVAVARLVELANIVVVAKSSPYRTLQELLQKAKAEPGRVTYGSGGAGTTMHLATVLLGMRAQAEFLHVPYKGTALLPAVNGEVDFAIENITNAMGTVQSGSLRALAVTSSRRLPQLPEVPTVMETGIAEFDVTTWNGLVAPAGTPRAIVAKLEAAALDALKDPDVAARFDKVGATAAPLGGADFEKFYLAEIARWAPIVKASGARAD